MNIDSDMYRLVKSLVDFVADNTQDINSALIENFYSSNRLKSNPFYYMLSQTISRLEKKNYIKIISKEESVDWLVPSIHKPVYIIYNVQYSIKKLREYLKNKKSKRTQLSESQTEETTETGRTPFCVEDKGRGYLRFSEHGEKIFIGRVDSRPYLFLKVMLNPDFFGRFYDVNIVMDKIHIKKDDDNQDTDRFYLPHKVNIIKNSCIKQLQKGNKLKHKITFEFDKNETCVKAKFMSD